MQTPYRAFNKLLLDARRTSQLNAIRATVLEIRTRVAAGWNIEDALKSQEAWADELEKRWRAE